MKHILTKITNRKTGSSYGVSHENQCKNLNDFEAYINAKMFNSVVTINNVTAELLEIYMPTWIKKPLIVLKYLSFGFSITFDGVDYYLSESGLYTINGFSSINKTTNKKNFDLRDFIAKCNKLPDKLINQLKDLMEV